LLQAFSTGIGDGDGIHSADNRRCACHVPTGRRGQNYVMKRCRNYVMRRCRSGSEGERDLKVSTIKLRNVPDTLLTHCTHPAGVDAGRHAWQRTANSCTSWLSGTPTSLFDLHEAHLISQYATALPRLCVPITEAGTASLDEEAASPEFNAGGVGSSEGTSWFSSSATFRRLIHALARARKRSSRYFDTTLACLSALSLDMRFTNPSIMRRL
jgi:hypothetical protein